MTDPTPIHLKLGYSAMLEKRAIRAAVMAEGCDPLALEFIVSQRYIDAHRNDPAFREISDRIRSRAAPLLPRLTGEQWAYLAERLSGSNDPVGIAICQIAQQHLKEGTT